jgi:electron transfer flavoprotein beta subunit
MRIIVCVKQVLDPRGMTVNRKAEKVFVNREEYILDPASKAALQVAAQVKAELAASNGSAPPEVVALSLGPDHVDDALREAMAFGADRAIHLKDAAFDTADAWVVANALAAAVRKMGDFDLVLLGARSLDTGSGELAGRLAEALDVPQLTETVSLELKHGVAIAVRAMDGKFVKLRAALPIVASVVPEAFEASHADGWRLMDAYREWRVETWSAADLSLAEDELRPASVKKEDAFPPERQLGAQMADVNELVLALKRERVV